jgi:hypothetical protein
MNDLFGAPDVRVDLNFDNSDDRAKAITQLSRDLRILFDQYKPPTIKKALNFLPDNSLLRTKTSFRMLQRHIQN